MKTRILSIIVVIAVLSSCSKDNLEPVAQEDNIILTQINPSEVPEGVEPLRFETLDEAKEYLREMKVLIENHNESVTIFDDGKKDVKNTEFSKTTTHICSKSSSISWTMSINSWIEYELDAVDNFTAVHDITSHLTGLTLGSSYTQIGYTKSVSNYSVDFTVYGMIEFFIWVGGNLNIWIEPVQVSDSFNQSCGGGGAGGGELPGDPEFE